MLRTWSEMRGASVRATDGHCGRVHDLFFDDRTGAIRHIVAALGPWPWSRRVLLEPALASMDDSHTPAFVLPMTRQQVRAAPDVDSHPPVSRQHEIESGDRIDLRAGRWGGAEWGVLGVPPAMSMEEEAAREIEREAHEARLHSQDEDEPETAARASRAASDDMNLQVLAGRDPHLRSAREVIGYEAQALGGRAGFVIDLWVDETSWQIAHLSLEVSEPVVPAERRIAIPATLVSGISWSAQTVMLNVENIASSGGSVLRPSSGSGSRAANYWRRASLGHG